MIYVVGIGPGERHYLLPIAQQTLLESDWVVGSERQLNLVEQLNFPIKNQHVLESRLSDFVNWLREHQQQNVTVLASGNPLLYGVGKYITKQFGPGNVKIIPGISAITYLFSHISLDMNELYLTSTHGKVPDFDFLLMHKKVALVTDQHLGPYQIAQQIIQRKLQRTLIIGENLSYPDEKITCLPAHAVADRTYQMNVVIILDER